MHIVSESDTRRYASEDVGLRKDMDCKIPFRLERETSVSKNAGLEGGGL